MLNKPKRPGYGGAESETPSSNLWVGNLPTDITESELTELFEKHGLIDGITCYSSRTYAFVYYKRVEDAIAAKDALQGFVVGGNPIKIEFAKPVCSDLSRFFISGPLLLILFDFLLCNRKFTLLIIFLGLFSVMLICATVPCLDCSKIGLF